MSNKSSIPTPGALIKAKREKCKKVEAVSIKPPLVEPDPSGGENHTYKCAYVSSKFELVEDKCSFDVWKRCEGRQIPGKPRDGLDSRLNNDFLMVYNGDGVMTDIDIVPKNYYASKAVLPDNLSGKDDIVLKITPKTGSVEVLQVPAGVTKAAVRKLLDALDGLDSIATGDSIRGGFEVINVSGNHVSIVHGTGI